MPRIGLFCITANPKTCARRYLACVDASPELKTPAKNKQLTMRINPEDRVRLHAAAADLDLTITEMVKTAIRDRYGVELTPVS